jgi:hypothetical protein
MGKPHPTYGEGPTFLEPQPFNVDLTAPETDRLYPRPRRQFVARAGVPNAPQEITPDRDLYPPRGRGVVARVVPRRIAHG